MYHDHGIVSLLLHSLKRVCLKQLGVSRNLCCIIWHCYKKRKMEKQKMNDNVTVCLGKGGQREMAESFARKNNVPVMDKPGEHLTVMFDSRGVSAMG